MLFRSATFFAVDYLLAIGIQAQDIIQLGVSQTPPEGVSRPIDPSFAGFGIEPSNLFSFTGYDQPNALTFNLINNLVNYTGEPPHLRLGGNTEDYMVFREDQTLWTWINNPNPVGQGVFASDSMLIGPRFFEAANRFPQGTPVTWGLNLAYVEDDWADQITTMARQVVENCPNLNLVSFEIGNEPDLYSQNSFRSGTWSGHVYTQEWLSRAGVIYEQVLRPKNITAAFFEPGCTASTIGTDFQIADLMSFDIGVPANGSGTPYIASWNQHDYYYYIGVSAYELTLPHFLQLSTAEDQFAAWAEQVGQAHATPFPYALREMGVVGPVGLAGITDMFGAALWTLNFLLYAATLNITTVQFHMTDDSLASAWFPLEMNGVQPHVRPLYYGFAAFDQVIGPSCTAQVAPLSVAGGGVVPLEYDGYVRAYAVYQAGQWQSLVVINSRFTDAAGDVIPSLTFQVAMPSQLVGQTVYFAYLSNTASNATNGTTWNGLEYESSGDGRPNSKDDGLSGRTVEIADDGMLEVQVRDSQAVVVNLGSRVGEGLIADATACAAIVQRRPGAGSDSSGTGTSSGSSDSNSNSDGGDIGGNAAAGGSNPPNNDGRPGIDGGNRNPQDKKNEAENKLGKLLGLRDHSLFACLMALGALVI